MRTLTPSPLAVFVTAVGLALALSQVLGSQGGVGAPHGGVGTPKPTGCSLGQFHAILAAENGEPVVKPLGDWWGGRTTVRLHWPDGWEVLPTAGGQVAVLDDRGKLQVRTGRHVILYRSSDPNSPSYDGDGAFIVCGANEYPP